jgi:hypothetical protein
MGDSGHQSAQRFHFLSLLQLLLALLQSLFYTPVSGF